MKSKLEILATAIAIAVAFFAAADSHAACLQNCTQGAPQANQRSAPNFNSIGSGANRVQYREKSPSARDVKNSVLGDVNIRVGHDKLDIRMDKNSSGNLVDASVSSTIILGDMKK